MFQQNRVPVSPSITHGKEFTVLSWNVLRAKGASLQDIEHLVKTLDPDIFLMQEAVKAFDTLPLILGGHYARAALPGRIHGTACWSRFAFMRKPVTCVLPSGIIVKRTAQLIDFGTFSVANVHLSHGQILNRRQLRHVAPILRPSALVMGDFNLIGPALLPGFRDVGPKLPTHRIAELIPVRIDRCLIRGMKRINARILPNRTSDHHPILVTLQLTGQ